MDIQRYDGTKERKEFDSTEKLRDAVGDLLGDPTVKKITIHLPKVKPLIPGGKKRSV